MLTAEEAKSRALHARAAKLADILKSLADKIKVASCNGEFCIRHNFSGYSLPSSLIVSKLESLGCRVDLGEDSTSTEFSLRISWE